MKKENIGMLRSNIVKFTNTGNSTFKDSMHIPIEGFLSVLVKNHETGEEYYHIQNHNTLTLIHKRNIVRMLGADNLNSRIITKMKFGDQGHNTSNPGEALPTYNTMTDLNNPFLTQIITSKTFADDTVNNMTSVTFEVELTTSEGNGSGSQIYSEAGLYTEDETPLVDATSGLANTGLSAVKHFGVLTKTSALSFTFQWKIIL